LFGVRLCLFNAHVRTSVLGISRAWIDVHVEHRSL
jgi:hypothetical protein